MTIAIPVSHNDIEFVKRILPAHYIVEKSNESSVENILPIRCRSEKGIRKGIDGEDDEHWGYIMKAFEKKLGSRFLEVNHTVCFCHTDFTIYVRSEYVTA